MHYPLIALLIFLLPLENSSTITEDHSIAGTWQGKEEVRITINGEYEIIQADFIVQFNSNGSYKISFPPSDSQIDIVMHWNSLRKQVKLGKFQLDKLGKGDYNLKLGITCNCKNCTCISNTPEIENTINRLKNVKLVFDTPDKITLTAKKYNGEEELIVLIRQ